MSAYDAKHNPINRLREKPANSIEKCILHLEGAVPVHEIKQSRILFREKVLPCFELLPRGRCACGYPLSPQFLDEILVKPLLCVLCDILQIELVVGDQRFKLFFSSLPFPLFSLFDLQQMSDAESAILVGNNGHGFVIFRL